MADEVEGVRMRTGTDTPITKNTAQTPLPPFVKWYRSLHTRTLHAGGVLGTCILLAAHQARQMGPSPFCYQVMGTLLVLMWMPSVTRHELHMRLPKTARIACTAVWLVTCGLPVARIMLVELLTGHRRPNMQWYNAVWRVYAILGLWMALCVWHKRWMGPMWTSVLKPSMGGGSSVGDRRSMSVAVQGAYSDAMAREERLGRIRERMAILLRRKKRVTRVLQEREEERQGVQKMLAEGTDGADGQMDGEGEHGTERTLLLEKADALDTEVGRVREDLDDIEDQLRLGQMAWTEALNVNNFRTFYR